MPRRLEMDRWLFGVTLGLCFLGALMVYSASAVTAGEQYGQSAHFLARQLLFLAAGLGGMVILMRLDYHRLRQPGIVFAALSVVFVLLVALFFFNKSHATHRWIPLGSFHLQPSELAKLAVILYLAWFFDQRRRQAATIEFEKRDLLETLAPAVAPVFLFFGLIVFQPDLGTSVEIVVIACAVLYAAGLSGKWFAVGAGAALPVLYLLVARVSYRYDRILGFLHPEQDPQGKGFQLLQSLIAVGSGGFTGVGFMESKQKLFYLPEAHTDFIFAVICEELGFVGAAIVIALFAVYGWRGMRAALAAPDRFGRLLALGITAMVLSQALINFAVVLGMVPTKGIPLPFVSYGGSSLLVMLLATGVLLNISQQTQE
ncbi:MAG TPA: putative lipid II flippase FtsW [Methylomirabilota bacterium]|nr:putative lipid II flippase FtsW [Methylomirabilota bacterium]